MKTLLPNTKDTSSKGFTLIELMVVIAIIAVLALIGISFFTSAQKTARDGRRKEDLNQVARAIETAKNPAGAQGAYTYIAADFTSDFANSKPTDPSFPASAGCYIGFHIGPNTAPGAGWAVANPGTCGGGFVAGVSQNGSTPANVVNTTTGWTLCVALETSATPYCTSSNR